MLKLIGYLKPWRGIIIGIICFAYLFFFVDYSKTEPPSFWEKSAFVIIMAVGWAGMILSYVDLWKSEKERLRRNKWLFPDK